MPYIGVCIWKQMVFMEEIGTFMCRYGTSPDLPLVKKHKISITRGRYQRMKEPIILFTRFQYC